MSEQETILVPVDGTDQSMAAVERALAIARPSGARLSLLHAFAFPAGAIEVGVRDELLDDFRAHEKARFQEFSAAFQGRGIDVETTFVEDDPAGAIEEIARTSRSPLIVMGSHDRHGLERFVMGSVAEQTLESVRGVTLLVVREDQNEAKEPIRSILFATDFSQSARAAEPRVSEWATAFGAEVEVLHVIRETAVLFAPYAVVGSSDFEGEMREAAEHRMDRVLERFAAAGVRAKSRIVYGRAAEEILLEAESQNVDLIALGTRGYSAVHRFLVGSVAQRVVRHATCDVAIVGGDPAESSTEPRVDPEPTQRFAEPHGDATRRRRETRPADAPSEQESRPGAEGFSMRLFALVMAGILAAIVSVVVIGDY